jgi:enoyl-CoA hydratase/carnithine racemase
VSSFYAEPSVILTVSRPIADIELNRPHKLTAIDLDCLDQLERHIEAAEVDNDVRAVVVSGRALFLCRRRSVPRRVGHRRRKDRRLPVALA